MNSQTHTTQNLFKQPVFIAKIAVSLLVSVLGLTALVGWYTANQTLIQILPSFAPMQFNTAIGFLLCGIGLSFAAFNFRKVSLWVGIALVTLGILTILQYMLGVDFGIDELLMEAYITVKSSHPGRMAPNTALCFALFGVGLVAYSLDTKLKITLLVSGIGGIVTALAIVVLYGYLSNIPDLYQWQKLTHMAVHTSAGFIFSGIGLALAAFSNSKDRKGFFLYHVPVLVCLGGFTVSLCLWQALSAIEQSSVRKAATAQSISLSNSVKTQFGAEILALERMADRWKERKGTPEDQWKIDAANLIKDFPSFQALEWVDSDLSIRWVVPMDGNQKAIGLDLRFEERRRQALDASRSDKKTHVSRTIDLVQGGKGILVYCPIFVDGNFGGFIVGVFRVQELFDMLIPKTLVENYSVSIFDGDVEVYTSNPDSTAEKSVIVQNVEVQQAFETYGVELSVTMSPVSNSPAAVQSPVKHMALLIGLIFSILTALGIYLAQKNRLRAVETTVANDNLNTEVARRIEIESELEEARDTALESVRLKSEFLANMSHEIRTPMNGVIGMLDLLLDTDLTENQLEFAKTVQTSADSLLTVIDDILDFSKIEAGRLEFVNTDFDLKSVVEKTIELFAGQVERKDLEISSLLNADVPHLLQGDPQRLRQVLTNLIGNAVKFTEKGDIFLRVHKVSETEAETVLKIVVQDTGIGIPKKAQGYLFQAFTQADGSMTRKYGGTGLGLTITKQLVEMMNGDIDFESEEGAGSTFFFTACFKNQNTRSARSVQPLGDFEGLKAIVVDDNAINRKVITHQLKAWGVSIDTAHNAENGLEKILEASNSGSPYELAILDLMMPGTDGFELAREIKAEESISDTRLILMPSFGQRGHHETSQDVGIEAYLIKPVRQDDLYNCIANVMGKATPDLSGNRVIDLAPAASTQMDIEEIDQNEIKILIAEDNLVNQKVTKLQVERLGYTAHTAMDGFEVLEALLKNNYAMVLMDCQMPKMNGYEATSEIRRYEEGNQRIPIIAVTANAMRGEREKCLSVGMDDYLAKPFKQAQLEEIIIRWLSVESEKSAFETEEYNEKEPELTDNLSRRFAELEEAIGEDILTEILTLFIEDSAIHITNIKRDFAAKRFSSIAATAHSFKGSSNTIGASELAALCHKLEVEVEDGEEAELETLIKEIDVAISKVMKVLEESAFQLV